MRLILFGTILGLAGCQTPNLGVDLTGNGFSLTSDLGDLNVTATGTELDTDEFIAGFTLCLRAEGRIATTIGKIPGGVGDAINRWITCAESPPG